MYVFESDEPECAIPEHQKTTVSQHGVNRSGTSTTKSGNEDRHHFHRIVCATIKNKNSIYGTNLTHYEARANMITNLDHIGIAVYNIQQTLPLYTQTLGLKLEGIKEGKKNRVKAALLKAGDATIELLEPLDQESSIAKHLQKRGQGIHHLAFKVDNIEKTLEQLKNKGVILIDEKPRRGIEGGKIAFLHPKSTAGVLIELCER
jgi:methylmalonyl-CoA/ethylmalonyl-CoA epimerase